MMRFLIDKRVSGKTTEALEWLSRSDGRLLLTFSEREADRLRRLRPRLADRIRSVKSMDLRGSRYSEVGVDNLDLVIAQLLRVPVDFATATGCLYLHRNPTLSIERLTAALDRYGRHDDDCDTSPPHGNSDCSCGFMATLLQAEGLVE